MDDVRIRRARGRADFETCVRLQREVWRLADVEITSAIQLIATTWAGGFVHLAETAAGEAVWPISTRTWWQYAPSTRSAGSA